MNFFKTGGFSRNEKLKSNLEIRQLFKKGKRFSCEGARLFILANTLGYNRICFSLSRGYGNAVQRNRSKRISRETYRYIKNRLKLGYDLVLIVYPGNDEFSQRFKQLSVLFSKAELLM